MSEFVHYLPLVKEQGDEPNVTFPIFLTQLHTVAYTAQFK